VQILCAVFDMELGGAVFVQPLRILTECVQIQKLLFALNNKRTAAYCFYRKCMMCMAVIDTEASIRGR